MGELLRPDGARLYFETHGDPSNDRLILLEGMGGDIPGWRRNIRHLAKECLVIAYDFRGNGQSDAPDEPMTMDTFVDDTVGLLDHLGLDAAHVYGQSFGGMVAQVMALHQSDRVRTLILAATHCGTEFLVPVKAKVPKARPYLTLYSDVFAREHPEHIAEDMRIGSQQAQRPKARRRQWEAMQGFDVGARLWQIDRPTLVLHGTEDRTVAVGNGHILAERIPNAELHLLEGAGHLYHSERAEEADEAVLDFIRRNRG